MIDTCLERLQQIQLVGLDGPAVSRVASLEVVQGGGVALEGVQQPVENDLAEAPTVGIAKGAAVADRNVALP